MPEFKELLYAKQRKGVLITLNRPEAMNAISRNLMKSRKTMKFAPWF
jgi:enoyl-CoA hydratase/carnithine racemase